jgi:chaperonin cofactor prefoldin
MGPELFNIYVEKLTNMVTELTKTNILQSAQITYYEKINSSLNSKVEELQKSLDEALNKVASNPNT